MKRTKRAAVAWMAVAVMVIAVLGGCSGKKTSDTVRWFNASYAILTELNGMDYNKFGGMAVTDSNKQAVIKLLDDSWGVTDRASADETLEWALTEGHRADFVEFMEYLDEIELTELDEEDWVPFFIYVFETDEDEATFIADTYSMYLEYGPEAIDGWDYCRAMNLLSFYYVAGYYTEEEALDKSLEIAQTFQSKYNSWDELVDSYLRGYEYWAEESSDDRRAVYEELKAASDNPYAVDYNTTLKKTW
ncbi:MAG: DUF1266 domain-containing protein [Clostridium sp.]|nr:DUF1266 domain-containing protein [Acetatifactor muris]MCM1527835.1 DUF1266 domain-containing protein [Bacteroides sp.]MCM1563514.1 DUF1266 domain-containing protein [Clostridium sp.]